MAINDAGQIAVVAYGPKAVLMTPAYLGDINEDGTIGLLDLLQLLAHWGPCATTCAADINHDGVVGHADLLLLLGNWSA